MLRKLLLLLLLGMVQVGLAQNKKDTTDLGILSAEDYGLLFSELDAFLDSLLKPQSFTSVSLSAGNRMVNAQNASGQVSDEQVFNLSPALGYYHKTGFGIGGSASLFLRDRSLKPAQYLATLSYDYLRNRNLIGGVAFTRFFRSDSLDFYTSPLQTEVSGYVAYRKSWLKPVLSVSYGWGSQTSVAQQEGIIKKLKKKKVVNQPPITTTTTTETVADFALSLSVRHDFYKLKVFTANDHFRFSPQLSLSAGTQKFGLNQTSQTMGLRGNSNVLKPFASDNFSLQEPSKFQPLSVTAFLRAAYTKGKFFVQPQFVVDYYLPESDNRLTTTFLVTTGVLF